MLVVAFFLAWVSRHYLCDFTFRRRPHFWLTFSHGKMMH
jgi:hypothetical protein